MPVSNPIKATLETPAHTESEPGSIAKFKGLQIYGLKDFQGMHANGV